MNISDNEIISRMESNPSVGMKLLMDAYQEKLYWHIRRLVVSHDDAQDLLQEVFLKVYRSFATFKGESSLFSWLYRIATNMTLSFLRNKGVEYSTLDVVRDKASDGYFSFTDEAAVALQESIHALPPRQQMVFNMRYYDDLSYRDIADICSISESAAKTNYHLAKNKVVEQLKVKLNQTI